MYISEAHLKEFEQMFQAFAPHECERWCYLLSKEPTKWGKITPIKVWPTASAFDSYPNLPLSQWTSISALAPYMKRDSVVLRCGHSKNPGTAVVALHEVLMSAQQNYEIIFEGFVSVVPGQLALGFNHEGGVCVFST